MWLHTYVASGTITITGTGADGAVKQAEEVNKGVIFNPIQDGLFWGCSRMGGAKRASLSHISYNDETWHSYALPKENPKNIWITWHTP